MKPLKIFLSYSHNKNDRPLLDQLLRHLVPLVQSGQVTVWEDSKILPSEIWENCIRENLEEADLVVLMVSSDFIASDYVNRVEVPTALRRQAEGLCEVVPVLLRNCMFELMPYSNFEFLPKRDDDQKLIPVDSWASPDDAFAIVVRRLHQLLRKINVEDNPAPRLGVAPKQTPYLTDLERSGIEQQLQLATQKLQHMKSAHLLETDAARLFAYAQEIQKLEEIVVELKEKLRT